MSELESRDRDLYSAEELELLELMLEEEGIEVPDETRAITPCRDPGPRRLSFAQERLWFLDQLAPGDPAYNVPLAARLEGALDEAALARSLNEIVRRHETLRTTFAVESGRPVQVVGAPRPVPLAVVDLRRLAAAERRTAAWRLARREARLSFDLARGPLIRVRLLRLSEGEWWLLLTLHHIVSDGWSMGVFVREMMALYGAGAAGAAPSLPELPIQYGDFAHWQRTWLAGERAQELLTYWCRRLAGMPGPLALPADRPRPAAPGPGRGGERRTALGADLAGRLAGLARSSGTTFFQTLLAAFDALLFRYTGQADVVVGSPVANRNRAEIEPLIGFFVNTLVLRSDLAGDPSFRDLLGRVREMTEEAYTHQDLPFEKLVERLSPDREAGHSPLFQVMFTLHDGRLEELGTAGLAVTPMALGTGGAKFDWTMSIVEGRGRRECCLEYRAELFDETTVRRLLGHYLRLLDGAARAPGERLSALPLLGAAERQQVLRAWNDTSAEGPGEVCLHHLIAVQAERTPDAAAVVFEHRGLTYRRLDRLAGRLARRLRDLGVGPEVPVAICAERSLELMVGLVGILKAGGAYVPLDPAYPADRLAFMLEDLRTPVLLVQERLSSALARYRGRVVPLDGALAEDGGGPPPADRSRPEDLAYVIYTSGSTGRPKGAMNSHRAVVNRLLWMQRTYRLGAADRVLQKTPVSFDVSVWELFWPLITGARLVMARPGVHRASDELARAIAEGQITTVHFVPSMLGAFLEEPAAAGCRSLARVVCSGEALPRRLQDRFLALLPGVDLDNLYGPTEAAVDVTLWHCAAGGGGATVPIGRPIANTAIAVLDRRLRPAPIGVPGELFIGGLQVGRGYLGRPGLTAERFVPRPGGEPGARWYRTGDLVRYLTAGAIEFLGRIDHQVKVRGMRIELGECEAALLGHAAVAECVVAARDDPRRPGERLLVAYVVPEPKSPAAAEPGHDGARLLGAALRRDLERRLPAHMVPAAFVPLSELPRLPNGKVDRAALGRLPLPAPETAPATPAAPAGEEEIALARIWAEVLHVERVGSADRFFDLGGHSLLATQMVSRVREALGVELPVREVFSTPALAELAARVAALRKERRRAEAPPLTPRPRGRPLPLSFAQERLWFLDQLAPGDPSYNVAAAFRLHGRLSAAALERAFGELARRHETLRTSFTPGEGGMPVQVITADASPDVAWIDLGSLGPGQRQAERERLALAVARGPFELARGPLLRVRLLRLSEDEHALLLAMHHIVSDGWSIAVLVRELTALYRAHAAGEPPRLPELAVQYADYSLWQRDWLRGERLAALAAHWRTRLAGAPQVLELPADRRRPAAPSYRGARRRARLGAELSARLHGLGRNESATLFMVLLAAFQALLSRYTGQEDVVVGSPVANRNRIEVEGLIGFFVNTVVLRAGLAGDPTFRELLGRVRDAALAAYAHQDLPFEKLVEELAPARDLAHTPLFQVMLVLQNTPAEALRLPGLTIEPLPVRNGTTKHDLTLFVDEAGGELAATAAYRRELFDATTIERLLGHFRSLLAAAAGAPGARLSTLALVTAPERHQVLAEWSGDGRSELRADCIHRLVEAWAERAPAAPAVVFEDESLSYRELDRRANQLANHLRRHGVSPEGRVGLLVERSAEMIVGLLGVLKAGGAYVPLDRRYPPRRLAFMLEDSRVSLLVSQRRLAGILPPGGPPVLWLDDRSAISTESAAPPAVPAGAANLAYVIYTSGSTGRPKGVGVEHRQLAAYLRGLLERLEPPAGAGFATVSTLAADLGNTAIFAALATGGTLHVISEERLSDPAALAEYCRRRTVDYLKIVPSHLAVLLDAPSGAALLPRRCLILGGEAAGWELARKVRRLAPGCRILNHYGPTETTVGVLTYLVKPGEAGELEGSVPVGRPLAGARVHVASARLRPLPMGVPGQVLIGGGQVARGYLGRPGASAEVFLPDPFSREPGARLYAAGDLARFGAAGHVEFLGRADQQVKIRGFRVEPGEVEAALGRHPAVRESAVVARTDRRGPGGVVRLAAYVVPAAGSPGGPALWEVLGAFLRERLPEHAVPGVWIALESLPLTPNGKLDRGALPPPPEAGGGTAEASAAPRTPAEEVLAEIWAGVLERERVGRDENFFALGGHSLLATLVVSRVRSAFKLDLPLRDLFEAPTVSALAARIERASRGGRGPTAPPIEPVPRTGELPLSFAQQRLWFIDRLQGASPFYNMPLAAELRGKLHVAVLASTFNEIVRRHEALRTNFEARRGRPVQAVRQRLGVPLPVVDLSRLARERRRREARRLGRAEARRPFDLAHDPLLRTTLVRLAERRHMLLAIMHHIVADAWSVGVLVREVAALYRAFALGEPSPLGELPVQYADFACWQRRWLSGEVLETHLAWWRRHLGESPRAFELPTDRPRPALPTYRGARRVFLISGARQAELRALSRDRGVSLFMLLLAAFNTLLYRRTEEADVLLGVAVSGRERIETEALIGCFIGILAIRTSLAGNPRFRDLLEQVRETTLEAFAHQDLPYESLVARLRPEGRAGEPLVRVTFGVQNTPRRLPELPGLELDLPELRYAAARFDLTLWMTETEDGLAAAWTYSTDLFREATIARLNGHFENLLGSIVADPEARLDALAFETGADETRRLAGRRKWKDSKAEKLRSARRRSAPDILEANPGDPCP